MPGIILGKNKISKKYHKLVAPDYLKLQQKIIDKIKSVNGESNETRRLISGYQDK